MSEQPNPVGASDDDIIMLSGLSVAEDRAVRALYAQRAEQSNRERMAIAARWAIKHGQAVSFDSKRWPVDDGDWPLHPQAGAMPETMSDYRKAIGRAKARRTRRANAARRAAIDIAKVDLSGLPPFGLATAIPGEHQH